ncbi:MAG: hypothetical protein ACKVY0_14945 [Prosthecobacter sp.]|uniref:hypothetical protein n=1 Tax=Prosthecobacter sp. TaxID=1965333 RepID=UPI0039014113
MFSNRKTFFFLGTYAWLGVAGLWAQTPVPAPVAAAEARPDLPTLQAAARAAEAKMPAPELKPQSYFDLAPAQRDRWQKFLPQLLLKLTRRERVQIVVLGDAMLDGVKAQDGADPLLTSFVGVFAKALANQFYYTGGVRVVRPGSKLRSKENMVMGPEILIQPVRTTSIVSAASALATAGFQGRPDVVLVAHGLEDGVAGTSTADVASALRSILDTARTHKLEVIVAGPIPQAADPEETSLALTRGASSVMREFCATEKILFSDLGDFSRLVTPLPGTNEAHLLFPALMQQYQSRLNNAPDGMVATPTPDTHMAMGRILFEDVMSGSPAVAWSLSEASATLEGQGKLKFEFQIANTSRELLHLTVLPLVPRGLKLKDTNPELTLAAGAKQAMKVSYTITNTLQLPFNDGKMSLPVLVIAGKESRIQDLVVPLRPFSVAWNARTAFNQESEFSPELEIENSMGASLSAAWESNWAGKKQEGKVALDANGSESLKLALALPADEKSPFRQRLPLNFAVEANGARQIFDRYVEITRNFGLKETVPLSASDGQASAVTLRADADGMKLFLTLELTGVDLVDDAAGKAFTCLLNLDARSYGQRLTPGATAALRISGKAGDGAAEIAPIEPWAFGSGYAAEFDVKEIQAVLSSTASGGRRLTITLPKSYLYRHEWALENGNSQLGINVRLAGGGREYFLTRSTRQSDDAESLSVLELTEKPTRRWTVRVE